MTLRVRTGERMQLRDRRCLQGSQPFQVVSLPHQVFCFKFKSSAIVAAGASTCTQLDEMCTHIELTDITCALLYCHDSLGAVRFTALQQ